MDERLFQTFTVDRCQTYKVDKPHLGIYRVLQGFEVVLLTLLAREVLKLGGVPISLDHDGLVVMFSQKQFSQFKDAGQLCDHITNGDFLKWSYFLLEKSIPVEPKRLWIAGNYEEF